MVLMHSGTEKSENPIKKDELKKYLNKIKELYDEQKNKISK